jgi:hypothetical protein
MSKIRVISAYTDEVLSLKDNFLKTLKDDWVPEITYWGNAGEGKGDFGTAGFVRLTRKKLELIAENVKRHQGDILVWADLDIQFFGKCTHLFLRALKKKDIVFQEEHLENNDINAGFIVMRCNPAVAGFFDSVLAVNYERSPEEFPYSEQSAIEKCLHEEGIKIKWGVLPWQFYLRSHGWPPAFGIVLHHANCTWPVVRNGRNVGSIELKLEQFEEVKRFLEDYKARHGHFLPAAHVSGALWRMRKLGKLRVKKATLSSKGQPHEL